MSQCIWSIKCDHSALPDLVFSIWAGQVQFWFSSPAKQRCHLSVPEPEKYLQNICLKNKTNNDEINAAVCAILNCQQTTLVQGLWPRSIFLRVLASLFNCPPPFFCVATPSDSSWKSLNFLERHWTTNWGGRVLGGRVGHKIIKRFPRLQV